MFSLKDLEIFKTHAFTLTPPLFTAAFITDEIKTGKYNLAPAWLIENPWLIFQIIGWGFVFLSTTFIVYITLLLIDYWIVSANLYVASFSKESAVFFLFGTSFITAGLLILLVIFKQPPVLVLNPFWHLGFLAYGFTLIERA